MAALTSCIDQDLSNCPKGVPITIKFEYSYNESGDNLILTDVTRMDLYAFDQNGMLVAHQRAEDAAFKDEMTIELAPGKYSFVAWGGEVNSDSYKTNTTVGTTAYEQARLQLECVDGSPKSPKPYNLFFGSLGVTDVSKSTNTATISLVKNTKNITVVAKGLDLRLPTPPASGDNNALDQFTVQITGDNAYYKFDDSFDVSNTALSNVLYAPYMRTATSKEITTDFRVMRLARQQAQTRAVTDNVIKLQIYDKLNAQMISEYDLIDEIIAQHPLINTNPNAELDKYSDYKIEVVFSYNGTNVYVEVNNWKVRVINVGMD